jgi:transcriptional regulator with XRE-family HTH domain
MSVGKRIKQLRSDLGMSQVDFAKAIGVSKQTLYKYENDLITNIPSDKIEAAATVCKVTPGFLMGWDDEIDENTQHPEYYTNPETAKVAQQIFDDPDLHALFDAARDSKPEDLLMAADLLRRLKGTNPDG